MAPYRAGTYTNQPSKGVAALDQSLRDLAQKYAGFTSRPSALKHSSRFGEFNKGTYDRDNAKYQDYATQKNAILRQRQQAAEYESPQGDLMREQQGAMDKANAANEERYQQLLELSGGLGAGAEQMGATRAGEITASFEQGTSDAHQRLVDLGMANTTIWPTLRAGMEEKKQKALSANAAQTGNAKDIATREKMGIMERRTDSGPNTGQYLELLNKYGRS